MRAFPSATHHYDIATSLRRSALLLPFCLALTGCVGHSLTTSSITPIPKETQSVEATQAAVSAWGERYSKQPADKAANLNYAAALQRAGRTDQAIAVLQGAAIRFGKDREVLAAYGKALAADGQLDRALQIIRKAQTPARPDWRLLSAEAAILDQKGMNEDARKLYRQARGIAPNEPTILSNLGMSYVLTGELAEAETLLRQAEPMRGADSRIRQNLALVVGLQGRFTEAETIASRELSAEEAAANVAYLKAMLAEEKG